MPNNGAEARDRQQGMAPGKTASHDWFSNPQHRGHAVSSCNAALLASHVLASVSVTGRGTELTDPLVLLAIPTPLPTFARQTEAQH